MPCRVDLPAPISGGCLGLRRNPLFGDLGGVTITLRVPLARLATTLTTLIIAGRETRSRRGHARAAAA